MEYTLVVVWLAVLAALAAAATPLAALLLDPLPDRGSGLGLPVAIATLGVASYWVGQVAFGWPGLIVALVVVLGGSAFALSRGYEPERGPAVEAFVVFVVGFLLVVAIRAADAAASRKWPMFAFDDGNTGYSSANAPNDGIAVRWDRAIDATGEPTFDSVNAYVRSTDGSLYALDRGSGETRWRYRTDGAGDSPAAAAVSDGTAFMDDGAAVLAVRTASQERYWRTEVDDTVSAPVTVTDSRVLAGTDAGTCYSLSRDGGARRWTFDAGDPIAAAPARGPKRAFFATETGTVVARESQGGSPRWEFETDERTADVAPVVSGDRVYIGDTGGTLYAIDRVTGEARWRADLGSAVVGGATVARKTVFVATADGTLHALNSVGGSERWSVDLDSPASRKPIATGETIYVATTEDTVHAYAWGGRDEGSESWRADLPVDDPSISVVDDVVAVVGGLYVAVESGSQTAIDRGSFDAVTTRWTYGTDGVATGSPALTDDALYSTDDAQVCYALDPTEGGERWRYEADTDLTGPVADADGVYLGAADGTVRALDVGDGTERWTFEPDSEGAGPIPADPIRWSDLIVAMDTGGRLYGIDRADGTERWVGRVDSGGTSPAAGGDRIYASSPSGVVSAFDAATGEELWGFRAGGTVAAPAATTDSFYVGNSNGRFYAVNAESDGEATERWAKDLDGAVRAAPTVAGDTVYVGTVAGTLYAFDLAGDRRWRATAGEAIRSKPGVAGDLVTVGSENERVYAFDATDGSERWAYDTAAPLRTTAAFGNDTVYVASAEVAALDPPNAVRTPTPSATPSDSPTPTPTDTPGSTPAPTDTPTDTPGGTPTPTDTPARTTPTNTPTATPTDTPAGTTPTSDPTGTPTPATQSGGATAPTATPTDAPTPPATTTAGSGASGGGADGGGGGPLDGLDVEPDWLPYAGAGAVAAVAALGAAVKRFGGGGNGGTGGTQADALDWGGGLDDDDS